MRPTLHQTFMRIAGVLADRASCLKRHVGCVIIDEHGRIISTGYNGKARGTTNCTAKPCSAGCEGVHAEVNALLLAQGRGATMYVTHAPCWHCMKTIINSSVRIVIYNDGRTLESRTFMLAFECGVELYQYSDGRLAEPSLPA